MSTQSSTYNYQPKLASYTYPQFIIDEKTGKIEVNFIDGDSGRVLRHIPSAELGQIVRNFCSIGRTSAQK
jgi:uncharacterized FlaG/YvyC family protein